MMTYRFYKVTAIVAVEQWRDVDLCEEHMTATRTGIDAVEMCCEDDTLISLTEEELFLTDIKPQAVVK